MSTDNKDAVRDAALEEAANECERMMMYPGGRQESAAHNNVWDAAKAIRALKAGPAIAAMTNDQDAGTGKHGGESAS